MMPFDMKLKMVEHEGEHDGAPDVASSKRQGMAVIMITCH